MFTMQSKSQRSALTYRRVIEEARQGPGLRKSLYKDLERELGEDCKIIAFSTSFDWPVLIQDADVVMLEEVLQNCDLDRKKLVLLLNSPGGEALPAERIVNVCRSYAYNEEFSVIVPKMAKSAATMICFGASSIGMSTTSELGPIDPQVSVPDEKGKIVKVLAAHEIIDSYNELIERANRTKGRIEPYLQQLNRFDARDIKKIESAQKLSESIAVRCLKSGVMSSFSNKAIKSKIKPFLDPKYTISHGRSIFANEAKKCGLRINIYDPKSSVWRIVWEIYIRLNYFLRHEASKIIECSEHSYTAPTPS